MSGDGVTLPLKRDVLAVVSVVGPSPVGGYVLSNFPRGRRVTAFLRYPACMGSSLFRRVVHCRFAAYFIACAPCPVYRFGSCSRPFSHVRASFSASAL
ncbi:hypothetical protein C8T65DRAFT_321 [Cerioporus squamosus]|nr:hypothetical protein C8T65DRAFT_321 [Cerioporus squamosus]